MKFPNPRSTNHTSPIQNGSAMARIRVCTALFLTAVILFSGCTVNTAQYEFLRYRRNADIVSVDPGNRIPKTQLAASLGYQIATGDLHPRSWEEQNTDTAFSGWVTSTMTTYTKSELYEARHALSLDLTYGILDMLGAGVEADVSVGDVSYKSRPLTQATLDMALYLRMYFKIKKVSFGIRPEFLFSTLNGERMVKSDVLSPDSSIGTLHQSYPGERITVFVRYDLNTPVSFFLGAQERSVIYAEKDNELQYENVIALYGGASIKYKGLEAAPYLGIPLNSTITNTRSPVQIGVKAILLFPALNPRDYRTPEEKRMPASTIITDTNARE